MLNKTERKAEHFSKIDGPGLLAPGGFRLEGEIPKKVLLVTREYSKESTYS